MGVIVARSILMLGLLVIWSGVGWSQQQSGFYVFFQKPQSWSEVYLYSWYDDEVDAKEPFGGWPGERLRSDSLWYQAYLQAEQLDANDGMNLIFHSGRGQQTVDLYRQRVGWYILRSDSGGVGDWYDTRPDDPLYQLIVESGSGSGLYRGGSLVTIEAQAPDAWSRFRQWSGAGRSFLADPEALATQLSMPQQDTEIVADFQSYAVGAGFYQNQCGFCHGAAGEGGIGPSLKIADGACPSCETVSGLTERIALTMPLGNTTSCQGDQVGDCSFETARFIREFLNQDQGVSCEPSSSNTLARRLRLLTKEEYWETVQDLLGFRSPFPDDVFWPEPPLVRGFDNNSDAGVITDRHLKAYLQLSQRVLARADWLSIERDNCQDNPICLVEKFGLRAFRRPLTSDEVTQYQRLLQAPADEIAGKQNLVQAMLLSPHFLYRSELGQLDSAKQIYQLSEFEIASLISYSTIGSMPDDALFTAAVKGLLTDPNKRQIHVKRLLDQPRSKAYLEKFTGLWLDIENLLSSSREDPSLTPQIRRQMIEESKKFVSQTFLDPASSFEQFFTADYTYTQPELARYYGLADSDSPGLAKRSLDTNRSGILGHGSILASQSLFVESSPIKRGVFVRSQLLCQDLPPPPANVDTTIPPPIPGQTIRDRLIRHQSQGEQADGANSCFSCHRFIDSIGFGLESFDFAGKFRTVYEHIGGVPVDASGSVLNIEGLNKASLHEFQTVPELGQVLADSQSAKDCVVTQIYRYTYGVSESRADQCAIDELNRSFAKSGHSVRSLLEAFSASDYFIYRQ